MKEQPKAKGGPTYLARGIRDRHHTLELSACSIDLRYDRHDGHASCKGEGKDHGLARAITALMAGDTLIVTKLDRLARSTRDLLNTLNVIVQRQSLTDIEVVTGERERI